jgi:WD repeat-containing protein 48
MIILTAVCR